MTDCQVMQQGVIVSKAVVEVINYVYQKNQNGRTVPTTTHPRASCTVSNIMHLILVAYLRLAVPHYITNQLRVLSASYHSDLLRL